MNVIGYVRCSTEEQARSGLGLDAQRERISHEAERRGWEVEWIVDDGYTAAHLDRPGLQLSLSSLRDHTADTLVVSRLDRLSRSLVDFANLMERARKEGWSLVALDLGIDMSTSSGALIANVMASFAEFERQLISERTSAALQALKSRGQRLGRPVQVPGAVRAAVGRWRALQPPVTWQACATALNDAGVPTAHGGRMWYPSTVRAIHESVALDDQALTGFPPPSSPAEIV